MRWLFISIAASLSLMPSLRGEEKILGAAKAIAQIQETLKQPQAPLEPSAEAISPVDLMSGIQQLEKSLKTIKSEEHAARWLKLAEGLSKLIASEDGSPNQANGMLPQLVAVIPPPETWDKLIEGLRAKPLPEDAAQRRGAVLLHGLAAILANEPATLEKLRSDFLANNKSDDSARPTLGEFNDPFDRPSGFRSQRRDRGDLEPSEQVAEIEKMLGDDVTTMNQSSLEIPDLITVLGEEKAKVLADKILKSPEVQAINISSTPTRKLFKERALALGAELRRPLWELVEDADDLPLYEAFSKLPGAKTTQNVPHTPDPFGEPSRVSSGSGIPLAAENVLLAKLLDEDRNDDIKKIILRRAAESSGYDDRNHSYGNHRRGEAPKEHFNAERADKLLRIYETTFADKPLEMPWADYLELASKQQTTEPVLKTVDRALADEKLKGIKKFELATLYFDYLLIKELNTDAVKVLRTHLIDIPASAQQRHSSDTPLSQSLKLHFLGILLDNDEWAKEGLEKAEKIFAAKLKAGDFDTINREFASLFEALLQLKRYGDAEKLAIDTLTTSVRQESSNDNRNRHYSSSPSREALFALCVVYDELNRRDEIIKLFETAPWWQTTDLGSFIDESFAGRNIGVIAARAMADAKQTDHALRILDVVIEKNPGLDAAYELLIGIDPAGSMKKLEAAAKRDPYQERPLIWQARLLLEAGDIPRAGQTIREAITIDPSDGEQGKNTRMLAYKVLAEVLRKEGDEDAAKIFDGVIAAIRKSERADDYNRAGLHAIARKMYKDSLALFNDAYCIQSRLAIELFENGDLEQAAIHYERAFQLMPGSFGMIESHCFGCEGAFASELAQSLAEKIFLRLLQEDPKKPQVHYLLGYLRSTQGRNSEALKHYQEAVRLAPRYLNAWLKLASIAEKKPEHAALFDQAQLALLRIDPQQKHSRLDTDEMHDLRKLWTALQTAAKEKIPPATFSYELAAVKAEQERAIQNAGNANGGNNRYRGNIQPEWVQEAALEAEPEAPYPGQALSRNRRIQELEQLLSNDNRFN